MAFAGFCPLTSARPSNLTPLHQSRPSLSFRNKPGSFPPQSLCLCWPSAWNTSAPLHTGLASNQISVCLSGLWMAIWTKTVHPSFTCPLAAPPSVRFIMVTVHRSPAWGPVPHPTLCLSWPRQCPWNLTWPLAHRKSSLESHRVMISAGRHSLIPQELRIRGRWANLVAHAISSPASRVSCPVSPEGLREPGRYLLVIREPQVRGWTGTPFPRGHSTLSAHSREGCCCVIPSPPPALAAS